MALAGDAPTTVGAVAERYGIPEGALAKAFQQLVRAGLATGTRGIGGGYRLARAGIQDHRAGRDARLRAAVANRGGCLLHDRPGQQCPRTSACGLHWLFNEVDELVRSTYESVTLQTLVRRARRNL